MRNRKTFLDGFTVSTMLTVGGAGLLGFAKA
jgi:hypothetical protein